MDNALHANHPPVINARDSNGVRDATLTLKEQQELIHTLLKDIFKNPKRGYNWLIPKFGKYWQEDAEKMSRIIGCLVSKKVQSECPIHQRTHSKPKV